MRLILRYVLLTVVSCLPVYSIWGHDTKTVVTPNLSERLSTLIGKHRGVVSVSIKHLPTGETFQHSADRPMPTASLIKFPVLVAAHHEAAADRLHWDDKIVLKENDKVPGSGILTNHFSEDTAISVRDAARLMIVFSDNTATNLVVDKIGLDTTAELMSGLGLPNTKLHSKVFRRDTTIFPDRSKQFGLGSTTANEMLRLFEKLWTDQLVSAEACQAMKRDLFACDDRSKLARFLPEGVRFAHKTGAVSQSRCDAGVIDGPSGPTIVCVLTTDNRDQSWNDENAANRLCAEIGRAVFAHFHAAADSQSSVGDIPLAKGAMGPLVRALQRTLNKRLTPSPELALDGDFGPATEAAVVRFQETQPQLTVSGVVDRAMWDALGTLETEDESVPPPTEVNAEVLSKASPDPLHGVPFVTCKAWAVLDAESGELIGGHQVDQPLDMASTTKIMTAFVALKCCQREPQLLDMTVVFSERADDTIGSTSGVARGEKISVGDLLYGLLLPSGNDASVALAEFLGRHVAEPSDETASLSDSESYGRFIEAMNETARELGLDATFKNPHGLTTPGHVASARSLAVLTRAAMQNELFREIVSTRQRGCTLESTSGYKRNVVWKNSNRLLEIDGYLGVKTGTTKAAGACLVSVGQRAEDSLITVVLGSSSSDARYVDTRNLYRWAWNRRATNQHP